MAVAYGSIGTVTYTAVTTAVVVPVPAGTVSGDLLICQIVTNGGAITALAGWTTIVASVTVTNPRALVQYRVSDGTEGADETWTVGSSLANGAMMRFTGVDPTTPLDVAATKWDSATTVTAIIVPDLTTVTNGCMLVSGAGANSGTVTFTQPSTQGGAWTERFDSATIDTSKAACMSNQPVLFATAGAVGTMTITASASRASFGWMAALRPAAVGGGPVVPVFMNQYRQRSR